jgi:hypothetical protein
MITLRYRDEVGDVEASFESIDEYNKFKAELIEKVRAKNEETKAKAEQEVKKLVEKVATQWNELKSDAKALVDKAKSYGVNPKMFLALIKGAMYDASDDRCIPSVMISSDEDKDEELEELSEDSTKA